MNLIEELEGLEISLKGLKKNIRLGEGYNKGINLAITIVKKHMLTDYQGTTVDGLIRKYAWLEPMIEASSKLKSLTRSD